MPDKYERAIISSVMPKIFELAREMKRELLVETPIDTGDMKEDVFASVDDLTGEIELGYDETGRAKPHSYYVVFGTSKQEPNNTIGRVVYRRRKDR